MAKGTETETRSGFQSEGGIGHHNKRKSSAKLAHQYEECHNQITNWKQLLGERAADVFDKTSVGLPAG